MYSEGKSTNSIAKTLNTDWPKIDCCINKALEFGVITELDDLPRKGRPVKQFDVLMILENSDPNLRKTEFVRLSQTNSVEAPSPRGPVLNLF